MSCGGLLRVLPENSEDELGNSVFISTAWPTPLPTRESSDRLGVCHVWATLVNASLTTASPAYPTSIDGILIGVSTVWLS